MAENNRFVALVRRPYEGKPSRQYVGLPAADNGELDSRESMAIPRVLVLENRPDGIFLDRFDESGEEAGDTWHESIDDAKAQAIAEYGENLDSWTEVPPGEDDPVAFALRLADTDV
jgi:hypothetical protein